MITPDGWLDWAIRYPGPDAKSGYWPNINESDAEGVDFHSAEGSASSLLSLVNNLQRQASWTASNMKDGKFYQHYPIRRIVWTNGSMLANVKFRGVESEGVAGEPLTAPQTANLIRCGADMRDFFGWPGFVRRQQAWEHNEMTAFGADATACPSGRIPWQAIIAGLQQEADTFMARLTDEQQADLYNKVVSLWNIFNNPAAPPDVQASRWAYWQGLLQQGAAPDAATVASAAKLAEEFELQFVPKD